MAKTYSKMYKLRTESDEQQEVINFCNSMADYGIEEYDETRRKIDLFENGLKQILMINKNEIGHGVLST